MSEKFSTSAFYFFFSRNHLYFFYKIFIFFTFNRVRIDEVAKQIDEDTTPNDILDHQDLYKLIENKIDNAWKQSTNRIGLQLIITQAGAELKESPLQE